MEITEVKSALDGLQAKIDSTLAAHTAEVEKYGKASTELAGKLDDLTGKYADTEAQLKDLGQKVSEGFTQADTREKSYGEQFITSDAFKMMAEGKSKSASFEVKNTISNLVGSPAEVGTVLRQADRQAGVVPGAFRALNVLDVIPTSVTSAAVVEYTREAGWTNAAAEAQEAVGKAESTLTFEVVTENIRTIAHFIKMSNQAMADAPQVQSYVNGRLLHGLRHRLQVQLLKGNGSAPNLKGLDQAGRHTAFTPVTADNALTSINKAKYAAIGSDFSANVVFLNPADFGGIERTLTGISGDKSFLAGEGNALSYINNGFTPMIWGLPVVMSNDVASGKFYVLDTNAVELVTRENIGIEMGYVNEDFTKNLVTIRAEGRFGLKVYQPLAVRYGDLTL